MSQALHGGNRQRGTRFTTVGMKVHWHVGHGMFGSYAAVCQSYALSGTSGRLKVAAKGHVATANRHTTSMNHYTVRYAMPSLKPECPAGIAWFTRTGPDESTKNVTSHTVIQHTTTMCAAFPPRPSCVV